MDRQRGVSPAAAQPRLQGLGGGLGAGPAAGRPPFSQQKLGLPLPSPGLPGASLRPGSLGSSSRLGSTVGRGLGALPLRSVGRLSIDANWAPGSDADAADAGGQNPSGSGTTAAAAADLSSGAPSDAVGNPLPLLPASRPAFVGASNGGAGGCEPGRQGATQQPPDQQEQGRRLGSLDGSAGGLAAGAPRPSLEQPHCDPQRRRMSAPAAGLSWPTAAAALHGAGGGGGAATGLPLRSHRLSSAAGDTQYPTPGGKGAASSGKQPLLPQRNQTVAIQWLPPVSSKSHGPDNSDAPKLAKQRCRPAKQVQWLLPEKELLKDKEQQQQEQLQAKLADEALQQQQQPPLKRQRLETWAAPARRLGGLRQPSATAAKTSPPPPVRAPSHSMAAAMAATAGPGAGPCPWQWQQRQQVLVPELGTLTAADWVRLQRRLEGPHAAATTRLHEALNALTVYSLAAPPPPPPQQQPGPHLASPPPPQCRQMQQQNKQGGRGAPAGDAGARAGAVAGASRPAGADPDQDQDRGVSRPATEGLAGGRRQAQPAAAEVAAGADAHTGRGDMSAAALRHGRHDSSLESDSVALDAATSGAAGVKQARQQRADGTAAAMYDNLSSALRAHPGVVRALWRLVGSVLRREGREGGAAAADDGSGPSLALPAQRRELRHLDLGAAAASSAGPAVANGCPGLDEGAARCDVSVPAVGAEMEAGTSQAPSQPIQQQQEQAKGGEGLKETGEPGGGGAARGLGGGGMAARPDRPVRAKATAAQRLAWAACAANVLRNLAAAEVVSEQLLCHEGLEACAAAVQDTLDRARTGDPDAHTDACSGSGTDTACLHDLVASLLEVLTALPHRLRLPAPGRDRGGPDPDVGAVGADAAAPVADKAPQPTQGLPPGTGTGTRAGQPSGVLEAPASVSLAAGLGPGDVAAAAQQEQRGRHGAEEHRPAPDRPAGRFEQQRAQAPARPLVEGVVGLMAGSADVPLRLRSLGAGLMAAWLSIPANRPAVLHALGPPAQPLPHGGATAPPASDSAPAHVPSVPQTPPGPETGAPRRSSAPPGVARGPVAGSSAAAAAEGCGCAPAAPPEGPLQARGVASEVEGGAASVRGGPLEALGSLLCVDAAEAQADARREVAAGATAAGGGGGRPDKVVRRLAAWRRADAAAAAVEVLHHLASDCGPLGRQLLASQPGLLRRLDELATNRPVAAAAAVAEPPSTQGASPAAYGNPLTARCRMTLAAAAALAAEALAALAGGGGLVAEAEATEGVDPGGGGEGGSDAMEVDARG